MYEAEIECIKIAKKYLDLEDRLWDVKSSRKRVTLGYGMGNGEVPSSCND